MRVLYSFLLLQFIALINAKQGGWAPWSDWSGWGKGLCSGNIRVKTRSCTNPIPVTDAEYCKGDPSIHEKAPVDGGYADWSQWSSCSKPCGGSVVNRTRDCNNPPPQNGGASCTGHSVETKLECIMECPEGRTDGGWSPWSQWPFCPKVCTKNGGVKMTRYRQCNMPPPMYGGENCRGNSTEEELRCFNICPIHGGFGQWSAFSKCSKECGSGIMNRRRFCNNPVPRGDNAKNCTGSFMETKHCKLSTCVGAVDGNWASWSTWNACTERTVCNKGKRTRKRTCTNPKPNAVGDDCVGAGEESEICPTTNCKTNQPTMAPTLPVYPGDYIHRECGEARTKLIGTQSPTRVRQYVSKYFDRFSKGYYAILEEEEGKIKKYCFEPYPPLKIKEAAELVPSYRRASNIPNYKPPTDDNMPTLGFSIRVFNDGTHKIKGYDFGINEAAEYVADNRMLLTNVMFCYYSEGIHFSFLAKGDLQKFSPIIFKSTVFHNESASPVSSLTGTAQSLKLKSLIESINIPVNNGGIGRIVNAIKNLKLWEFEFSPVSIGYNFKSALFAPTRITATKKLGGVPVHFEAIYVKAGTGHNIQDYRIAIGFTFDGESYTALLEKLSGSGSIGSLASSFLNAFGVQLEIGIAWCPEFFGGFFTNTQTNFQKQPLHDLTKIEVKAGLMAAAQVSIPKDCKDSIFCKVLKLIVGPSAKFRIAGHVAADYFKVSGGFYNIKLIGSLSLRAIEVYVQVNRTDNTQKIGFVAELKIPVYVGKVIVDGIERERYLYFGGGLEYQPATLDIKGFFYMRGMWYHAFGWKFLNMGNMFLGLTFGPESPIGLKGIELGGQLEFGKNCLYDRDFDNDGHCMRFQIYFGYGDPMYFYGKMSALTVGKMLRMFGVTASLPGPVKESGFPKGLRVQYCADANGVDLRGYGGPYIHDGFGMAGTLNLFGYEIKAAIKYSARDILIDGELDPINLGGHVIMSRNNTHKNVGPKFLFQYRAPPANAITTSFYLKIYFEGYMKILGIEASAYVNLTLQGFEIYVYGKVWNLVYCELYVSAGYSISNIKNAHFYIRVIVDLRGLTDAIENARKAVDGAFKSAQRHMGNAINKVKEEKRKCREKMSLKCSRCQELKCKQAQNDCKGFLDKAGKWIGGAFNKAGQWFKKAGQSIKSGLQKVGKALTSWRRRRALTELRDHDFDIHIRQRRFISKLICEGIVGGGCRVVANLCEGTCRVVDFIAKGLCSVLDVAVAALKVAQTAVGWINSAIQFLMQMFLVHGIRFELGLGQQFNGFMVGAEIDLTLFGKRMYFGFKFDLKNPFRSITSAKDGGLYRYKEGVRQLRTEPTFNPYDRPNPFVDFDLTGTFGIEALQTGTEDRLGSCVTAPTNGDNDQLVLVGCNATNERQRWTYTLKGSLINLKTKKCLMFPQSNGGHLYQKDCEKDKTNQPHECDVVTRTLKLRRRNLCVTAAKSTPLGPGSITHHGSLKCIQVASSQNLMLRAGCNRPQYDFEIDGKSGHLIYKIRNQCVRPKQGSAKVGAKLEVVSFSMGCHEFAFTKLGSLQHKKSGLCVQTPNKEMVPADFTELVLGNRCEFAVTDRPSGALPDAQMVFSFVPQNNKLQMKECADFYESKLEQRFAIMDEELHSVCSKFSPDLALHKSTSQSSVKYNGFSNRAVDGNYNFQWEKGSCMHTKEEQDPWWKVDLGKEYIVTDVTVINRANGNRLKNIMVHVGRTANIKRNPVCHDIVSSAGDGEAIRLQCNPPIPGRYVGIQMYGKGVLSVCEVVVASRVGAMADWCQIENGGCDQLCYNQCDGKTRCGCLPGYKLAYDGRTCLDIDECLVNNGGCRYDTKAHCVNYPGGYFCGCNKGYILKDNSLTECMDINECGMRNGACEQMCNNTLGGYMCTCRKGYERKPNDSYGCQNINECKTNNGDCDHNCFDYDGGHYCKCRAGFRLMDDGKSCEELYCSVLEAPRYGFISPSTCSKKFENIPVGTVCKTECSKGYEITAASHSDTLSCQIDGTWNHVSTSCHAVKCHVLPRPKNGGIVPARCHDNSQKFSEFGQRCVAYCKHGYRLRGPATKYCQADKKWSNSNNAVECVKIYEPPYLNCPTDIVAILPSTLSWTTLGSLWQEPQTNINSSLIQVYPDLAGPNYYFKYGRHLVSYSAIVPSGEYVACSFFVEIKDKTPPTMVNCPSDIIKKSDADRVVIRWTEPSFTDNVGIRKFIRPVRRPDSIWRSGESMQLQYVATDEAGHDRVCSFHVSFQSNLCPALQSNTDMKADMLSPRRRYSLYCRSGTKTFFGAWGPNGCLAECSDGKYICDGTTIGLKPPECVDFTMTTSKGVCKDGYVKFAHEDFFAGFTYYCANCPTGHAFNTTSKSCVKCETGKYQDDQGQLSCEICPKGQSTSGIGSTSISQCLDYCKPGFHSDSGLDQSNQPCLPCSRGSYSEFNGTKVCKPCPDDQTTLKEGATDFKQCLQSSKITETLPAGKGTVQEGFSIHFECMFEGAPHPEVTWSRVGGSLPQDYKIETLFNWDLKEIGSSISMFKLTVADAGKYKCLVSNELGSDEKIIELAVQPRQAV